MEIIIEGTKYSPQLKIANGVIKLSGKSIPENAFSIYEPIVKTLEFYLENEIKEKTEIIIHLEYINSGSSKILTNLLNQFNKKFLEGYNISIRWYYDKDDDSIFEFGCDLQSNLSIGVEIIEFK